MKPCFVYSMLAVLIASCVLCSCQEENLPFSDFDFEASLSDVSSYTKTSLDGVWQLALERGANLNAAGELSEIEENPPISSLYPGSVGWVYDISDGKVTTYANYIIYHSLLDEEGRMISRDDRHFTLTDNGCENSTVFRLVPGTKAVITNIDFNFMILGHCGSELSWRIVSLSDSLFEIVIPQSLLYPGIESDYKYKFCRFKKSDVPHDALIRGTEEYDAAIEEMELLTGMEGCFGF